MSEVSIRVSHFGVIFPNHNKKNIGLICFMLVSSSDFGPYQIIVADAADAVSVNFSGRCKFLQI